MTDLPKLNTVLFDMDETLIRHDRQGLELIQDVYTEFADALAHVEAAEFAQTLWQKASDMWAMMFDGAVSGDVARVYSFKNTLRALEVDTSLAEDMREAFEQAMLRSTHIAHDTVYVLETLREAGFRTGVVTNGYTSMQMRKIAHYGLDKATDFVLVSEQAGFHKPHPRVFEKALSMAGSTAATTLFVGDNLENDIAGALGAGIRAVLIDPEGERTKLLEEDESLIRPTHIVAELGELLPLVGIDTR